MSEPTGWDLIHLSYTKGNALCRDCHAQPAPVLIKQGSYCYRCALDRATSALCVMALQSAIKAS